MAAPIAEPPHLAADLKTLCLSTITAQWRPLAEEATRQRQAPADYLAQLAHLEVTGRRERRIQRRMQDARFPMLKTLDAFSFDAQPDLDRNAVLQVFGCGFVAEAGLEHRTACRRCRAVTLAGRWLTDPSPGAAGTRRGRASSRRLAGRPTVGSLPPGRSRAAPPPGLSRREDTTVFAALAVASVRFDPIVDDLLRPAGAAVGQSKRCFREHAALEHPPSTTRPAPPASPARWTRSGSSRCSRTPPRHRSLSPTEGSAGHAPRRDRAGRRLVQSRRSRQARDRSPPSRDRFTSPATPGRAPRWRRRPASHSRAAAPRPPHQAPGARG